MQDILGNLKFDSWKDSVPEVRGNAAQERHLIYEGGGFCSIFF